MLTIYVVTLEKLKEKEIPHTVKYIDPSYIIRSAPTNASDSVSFGQDNLCNYK